MVGKTDSPKLYTRFAVVKTDFANHNKLPTRLPLVKTDSPILYKLLCVSQNGLTEILQASYTFNGRENGHS